VLAQVHEVENINGSANNASLDPKSISDKMVFPANQVVRLQSQDVDLDFACKEGFQTDTQISSINSSSGRINNNEVFRDLEKWEPEEDDAHEIDLDRDFGGNGWNAEEMFKRNEDKYGVQSTYNPTLEGYTVQLNKPNRNSEEFRRKEAEARRIAKEIEGNSGSQAQVELENGQDEEEAFSAVVRSHHHQRGPSGKGHQEQDDPSKYVTPARRQNSRGGGTSQSQGGTRYGGRTTTPPHHGGMSTSHFPPRERESHEEFSRGGGRGGRVDYSGDSRRSSGGAPAGGGGYGEMPPRHHRQQQQQYHDKQVPHVSASAGSPRENMDHHRIPPQQKTRISPSSDDGRKKESLQQQPPQRHSQQSSTRVVKSHSEKVSEIKEFHRNFNMAPSSEEANSGKREDNIPHVSAAAPPTNDSANAAIDDNKSEDVNRPDPKVVAKNSTLNPNAKEFSFNPNAKPFIPGGGASHPSATPPARPQTPATPTLGHVPTYPQGPFQVVPGSSTPQMALAPYVPSSGAYPGAAGNFPHPGAAPRFRGGQQQNNIPPRMSTASELPHPMHVAGQPLLAPGPGGSGAPPSNFGILHPGQQIAGAAQPAMLMRLPAGNPVMVPTSMQATILAHHQQQQQQHDMGVGGGPASLPAAHWQQPPPGTSQPGQSQIPPGTQQPVALTQTPPSSSHQQPPPPNTTPSPGPQHLPMYNMAAQPQSLPPQLHNLQQFIPHYNAVSAATAAAVASQPGQSVAQMGYPIQAPHAAAAAVMASLASHQQQFHPLPQCKTRYTVVLVFPVIHLKYLLLQLPLDSKLRTT
jgi:hypothetical protein